MPKITIAANTAAIAFTTDFLFRIFNLHMIQETFLRFNIFTWPLY